MSGPHEEPCPWCHGLRSNFRCGDQGFGEEDIDGATSCPDGRKPGHYACEERPLRVEAERYLREVCERLTGVQPLKQSPSLADIALAIDASLSARGIEP